jgi:hypothetical protein
MNTVLTEPGHTGVHITVKYRVSSTYRLALEMPSVCVALKTAYRLNIEEQEVINV